MVLRSILYTVYVGRSAFLHLKRGIPLECRTTQGALEELLCSHSQFFCCSKGVIVNFHEVAQLWEDSFLLYDDSVVPISRRKAKAVQEAYARFRFEEMRREVQK